LLSARLQIFYDRILAGQPLWDIGCDHGYLGLHAHRNGLCGEVHLVDRSPTVLEKLRRQVEVRWPAGPGEGLRIWQLDAEQEALPVVGGTVVMAGLGIGTVLRIMARSFAGKVPAGVRLVLAPTLREELLRLQLRAQGWYLQHEELYSEAGHVRQLQVWEIAGESAQPFWNNTTLSRDNGLLDMFLAERRQYFSVSQSAEPDLVYLKRALAECFPE
jgi:tRNA (adenine22-N1)-methyltransferase